MYYLFYYIYTHISVDFGVDTNPISVAPNGASGSGFFDGFVSEFVRRLRRVIIISFISIYLFWFFLYQFRLPRYVCLLAKLACQVKFKQILLEQLCPFMGKWLDPLTVSILNFYAFIFMTVILMKKHFKPPLKWRKYHSSTLIHTDLDTDPDPDPDPNPDPNSNSYSYSNSKWTSATSSCRESSSFAVLYSYLCTAGIHS